MGTLHHTFHPTKKGSKNQCLDRLELRLAGKNVAYCVGSRDPRPMSGPASPRKRAKTGISGIFGGLGRQRGQISGRSLRYPHYMPHVLSSEPKLKAIQTLILRYFFSRAKGGVKGSHSHRSFPVVQLARPKCSGDMTIKTFFRGACDSRCYL